MLHDVRDYFEVETKIRMDDLISQANNSSPVNFGSQCADVFRHETQRLAHNRQGVKRRMQRYASVGKDFRR